MTKFNRINSKVVAALTKKHITDCMEATVKRYELDSMEELIKDRTKQAMTHNVYEQFIGAYDITKFMALSSLDFEYTNHKQKEFIELVNINPNEEKVDITERYIQVVSYHLQKMFDINPVANIVRLKLLDQKRNIKKKYN